MEPLRHLVAKRRRLYGAAVVIALAGLLVVAPIVVDGVSRSTPTAGSAELALTPPSRSFVSIDERVSRWEMRVAPGDGDYVNRTLLGGLYLEQARATGDLGGYERAEQVVTEALANEPAYLPARAALAGIQFGRHDFEAALRTATDVARRDPTETQALAVIGDANAELGRYPAAEEAYLRLAAVEGDVAPVLVRRARLDWLRGDGDGAVVRSEEAVSAALAAGLDGPELAFYQVQLATHLFETGRYGDAADIAAAAAQNAPGSPVALATLGRLQAALGDLDDAIDSYERSTAILPSPDHLASLGDLYQLTGEPGAARQQYDTVLVIGDLAELNRVVYNRQLARFLADHDRDTDRAVELAEAEMAVRQDRYGHDTLAWALHKAGRTDEALVAIERAMEGGTADARILFHAGMIRLALGGDDDAERLLSEALAVSPAFDPLQAPIARAALDELRAP